MFLDQRGTGLSSTVTAGTLARQGNAIKQAEYMKHFRADNIVRDCEAVRQCLTADYPEEKRKWSVIGQSFGGFCAVTYLSMLYVFCPLKLPYCISSNEYFPGDQKSRGID